MKLNQIVPLHLDIKVYSLHMFLVFHLLQGCGNFLLHAIYPSLYNPMTNKIKEKFKKDIDLESN